MNILSATEKMYNEIYSNLEMFPDKKKEQHYPLRESSIGLQLLFYPMVSQSDKDFNREDFSKFLGKKISALSVDEFNTKFQKTSKGFTAFGVHNAMLFFLNKYVENHKSQKKELSESITSDELNEKDEKLIKNFRTWVNKSFLNSGSIRVSPNEFTAIQMHEAFLMDETIEKVMDYSRFFAPLLGLLWLPLATRYRAIEKENIFFYLAPTISVTAALYTAAKHIADPLQQYWKRKTVYRADSQVASSSEKNKQALVGYLLRLSCGSLMLGSYKKNPFKDNDPSYIDRVARIIAKKTVPAAQ